MRHAPPVAKAAVAFGAGAAWAIASLPWWPALFLVPTALLAPRSTSSRPAMRALVLACALAGGLGARASATLAAACALPVERRPEVVRGRFLATPRTGSAPFEPLDGCAPFTVVTGDEGLPAGRTLALRGRWREGLHRPWFLAAEVAEAAPGGSTEAPPSPEDAGPRWALVRWRDGLVERIGRLYGDQAPLVAALTLARTEGFDPELRDVFARAGLAHILSISGFHVAVIAGCVLAALRAAGVRRRPAGLAAAAAAWMYVALIGLPDAACRAALILAFAALSAVRGRPAARWGALASAFVLLVALQPTRVAGIGFQLSFAGAAGLVAWTGPLQRAMTRLRRPRIPRVLASGLASGVAATLATLPIAAWHFEQVSVVGIPATLVASPLVAVALPGAILSVALDFVSTEAASFVAGGVSLLLALFEDGARLVGSWSGAAVWTTRPTVAAMGAGVLVATLAARAPGVGGRARRLLLVGYGAAAVAGWPVLVAFQGRGTLELLVLDVGQGDAVAVRSPRGRWLLVDTGPPARDEDPAAHPVVRALRSRGVGRLTALVLTHADLDHVGGAAAVLRTLEVGAVYDPALPEGKEDFVAVLRAAGERDVPWLAARTGMRFELDGAVVEVLAPSDSLAAAGVETNEASVILRVRYGRFDALLTGDAYKEQERALARALEGGIEVLKLGHHGSDTSTDPLLLERADPAVAIVSAGRGNRYGHPHPAVLARLERRGVPVRRTDQEGTLRVVARPDGTFTVRARGR